MQKVVVGNWKMNGSREAVSTVLGVLAGRSFEPRVIICPPMTYIDIAVQQLRGTRIEVGAQNVSEFESGAYTGEVSAAMLRDLGCTTVIVGHSERRRNHHETDPEIAKKVERALDGGMNAIACVGETAAERDAGLQHERIRGQLSALRELLDVGFVAGRLSIAYEPVWAIGTGRAAQDDEIADMHRVIKDYFSGGEMSVLYGGSVNGRNAGRIVGLPGVDGVLVGGASLLAAEFSEICQAAVG